MMNKTVTLLLLVGLICLRSTVNSTPVGDDDCPRFCTFIYAPVCGTDGVTYGNECALKAARCEQNTDLEVAYAGDCATTTAASTTTVE